MTSKIDLDRGVMASRMPLDKGGMYIYMYMDAPGIYLNEHGNKVSESLAKEVGFDINKWHRVQLKNERLAVAKQRIEAELELISDEIDNTLMEKDGFVIIGLPGDKAVVKDPDGNVLTSQPVSIPAAEALLEGLTAPEKSAPEPKPDLVLKNPVLKAPEVPAKKGA